KDLAEGKNLRSQSILLAVVFPHADEILGAQNQGFQIMVVFKYLSQRRRHERLSQADHVPDQHTAALVQMVGCNFDGSRLEFEQLLAKLARDGKAEKALAGILRKVIRHFDIDVERWDQLLSCPTLLDDLHKFVGDVEA